MTKPRSPRPDLSQEASKVHKPKAPFERIHQKPAQARPAAPRAEGTRPHQKVSPKTTGPKSGDPKTASPRHGDLDRTASKSPAPSLGAMVNRRAADRLRGGY